MATTPKNYRQVVALALLGLALTVMGLAKSAARHAPATFIFLDNGLAVQNGSATYDLETRICGKGKHRVIIGV